ELALIAQYAENEYFAKPCGVMDQTVSAVGGTICLDLEDVKNPKVTQLPLELDKMGLTLFNVDSKASHDDLTEEYTSMPKEMKDIAQLFMKDGLRRLDMETYINHVSFLRDMFGDRAVLRGMHFFMECKRVEDLCKAVQTNDKELFLKKITESGHSSYEYLQNAYVASNPRVQPMAVALSVAQSFLQDKGGAWRLQGGGFAGAIQCFVPDDIADSFVKYMEIVLGEGCCKAVNLRSCGAVKVLG
ncbi:MAG: galactokinase, partial [Oscillospiraceae bacterium]|nr:galactokinase [Oscillospiraceae bacterium]